MNNIAVKIISVLLEYGMLFWFLFFVARLAKVFRDDIKAKRRELFAHALPHEAVLTCIEGDAAFLGRRFAFSDKISIGRSDDNDIIVPETFVSHNHAVIRAKNNLYVIEDLNSANHTYLNNRELKGKAYIKDGDFIRVGSLVFQFGR